MVFDFSAWNLKIREAKNLEEIKYYDKKLRESQEEFEDDWRTFLECYNDPNHIIRINDEFLDEKIEEILERDVYIPADFRSYLYRRFPQHKKALDENRDHQIGSKRNSSVLACGLKPLYANAIYEEDKKRLLLFEVAEFTLTYPEYEELLIEEFIE